MFNMMTPFDRRNNDLFHYFDDFGRDFFSGKDNSFAPCRTDILDLGDHYELHADMPGFKKEDIKLSLNGETLTIKATRHSDFEDQDKKSGYLRCERSYGTYTRSFDVTGVEVSQISASYNDGVLRVRVL